jgi:hypothetical protein
MQLACVLTSSALVDWVAMALATAVSGSLIVRSVQPVVETHAPALARVGTLGLLGAQALFTIVLKVYFFRRISY